MHVTPLENRSPSAARYIVVAVAATIVAIFGQTIWAVYQDRRLTLAAEYSSGVTAVRLLEEHATLTLVGADRSLSTVVSAIHSHKAGDKISDVEIRDILTKAQPYNNTLKSLQFVNPAGVASVSSIDYPAFQTDADDRTYIAPMLKAPEQSGVVLGLPFRRFYDSELVVPFARNFRSVEGRYLGILSTDLSVSYFSGVYARVAEESQALVGLFTDGGIVIVRSPFEQSYVGQDISQSAGFGKIRNVLESPSGQATIAEGSFEDSSFLDETAGVPRLYIYRKIKGYPVVTVYAREVDSILSAWRQRTRDRLFFSAATVGFILLLTYFLLQHMNRLVRTQDSLRATDAMRRLSETRFINLFRYSPVPLAQIRLDNDHITDVNDAWSALLGYRMEDALNKTPLQLGLWANPEDRVGYLVALRRDRMINQLEVRFRHQDGRVLICLLSSRLIDVAGVETAIFSPIDVTRQREVEQEIRDLNTTLEERVSQRTMTLERTNRELGDALENLKAMQNELLRTEKMAALGALVAGVAHELNTPLGVGVTIASTIQDNAQTLLNELNAERPSRSTMNQIVTAGARASEVLLSTLLRAADLVNSFKQVAVDQASNNRRRFDVRKTINDVLVTLEPMFLKTRFRLESDLSYGLTMESYPGALGQIMTNLVGNALAHAFEGRDHGTMQLRVQAFGTGHVEIVFSDDGVGILPHHRERVFEPFFTTKLGKGGSGLGMSIVYNLVTDLMGGRIHLHSETGNGTTVTIILPLEAPHHRGDVESHEQHTQI